MKLRLTKRKGTVIGKGKLRKKSTPKKKPGTRYA